MAKRNYNLYSNIGIGPHESTRDFAVLNTGAERNFVQTSLLPSNWRLETQQSLVPDLHNAN